ncbi:Protein of unknown function [Pyronema omphalodes CBS 100304]|uniref:Uncharacterized protein n=1 Tax=Pyronema omphalodes (strain CBS 100304) TaxID=1076935 RepID=U4KWN3_PYROM|nr:Protein of unknown function [Pyronema omphalodes CBS 100304]
MSNTTNEESGINLNVSNAKKWGIHRDPYAPQHLVPNPAPELSNTPTIPPVSEHWTCIFFTTPQSEGNRASC